MRRISKPLLNRLLSGGDGLAAADKEEVLQAVLGKTPRRRRPWAASAVWRWAGLGALATSLLLFLYQQRTDSEFLARGVAKSSMSLSCTRGGEPSACRQGSHLLFKLSPRGARYFSVLAFGPGDKTLWYFTGLDLTQLPESGVMEQAAVLGPEHGEGTFEIVGVFSADPLDKGLIRGILEGKEPPKGTEILRQELVVGP